MQEEFQRSRLHVVVGALLAGVAPFALAKSAPVLFVAAADVSDSFHGAWLRLIYADAFRRLGYDFALRAYPTRRASAMSDSAAADGEINRVADYGLFHPDMVRVETSHFPIQFCAYGRRLAAIGDGWQALADNGQRRVEYRSGVARCQARLAPLIDAARLSHVSNVVLGLRKLDQGRTDLYVDIDSVVEQALSLPEFEHSAIRKLSLVDTVPMHAFVHKKHSALAARLASVLAAMHADGTIQKYCHAARAAMRLPAN